MARTETLEERETRINAEAAQLRQDLLERARSRAQERAEAQRRADEAMVQAWNPEALDAAVEQARRHLVATVEADPLTVALTAYVQSQTRRLLEWQDHLGALGRLGRPTAGAQLPSAASAVSAEALIVSTAERLAHDNLATEREANQKETS